MPAPKRWTTSTELVEDLRRCAWRGWFERGRAQEGSGNWTDLITGAVGSDTIRAFHGLPKPPLKLFRSWARHTLLQKQYFKWLLAVATEETYNCWLAALADDLRITWTLKQGREMDYGPSMKLSSLLAKRACLSPHLSSRIFERLVWFLHVPLDRYTIAAVSRCSSGFAGGRLIGSIPPDATMGFVRTPASYNAFQQGIKSLAADAQVPPIALDLLAWDYRQD